ncbi:MAG TPA: glycoside hydrolase family 2 TIM barrel-domain containing protein [Thermoleophilaceae bacterium]
MPATRPRAGRWRGASGRHAGKPLIREGQVNRELLGGTWYFRQDDAFVGEQERWFDQDDLAGWSEISVPHNWNATDTSFNRSSIGWYRKEFTLPRSPKKARHFWKLRFEGNNYRSEVWLNGKKLALYTGYFPFEVLLSNLRKGRNTLVVEVSSLRSNTDLTHWRPAAFNGYGTGGWWNFGGMLREAYVRRVDTVDVEHVSALPRLARVGGPARVEVRTTLRNFTKKDRDVSLVIAVDGQRIQLDPETVPAMGRRELRTRVTIKRPRLWAPRVPQLYDMAVSAMTGRQLRGTYKLSFGVRKIETRPGGIIRLNGRRLNLKGASIHEDDLQEGGALSQATRTLLLNRLKNLGATITRSHYPLHPAFVEALDRAGIMYWVDAPVYQVPTSSWVRAGIRKLALRAATLTVRNNINNPSVLTCAGQRAVGGGAEPRHLRAEPGSLHPRRLARCARARRHAARGPRPPVAPGRAIHHRRAPVPRRARGERLLRLVPLRGREPAGPAAHHHGGPQRLPRRGARSEPGPATADHRVRRRGQPLRARGPEGHVRVPAQVGHGPPGDPCLEAVRERLDSLGAARLPGAPDLAGRRAGRVRPAAVAQQEPDRGDEPAQAGLPRRGTPLPAHDVAPLACAAP